MAALAIGFFFAALQLAFGSGFRGKVVIPSDENEVSFLANTRVMLDGGLYTAFLHADGSFVFENIPSSSYQLEIFSPNHDFESFRVDLNKKSGIFKADLLGGRPPVRVAVHQTDGLVVSAIGKAKLFEEHQGLSIMDLLKNPMVLMLLPLLLTTIMPKLTANLSPEELEEMQKSSILTKPPNMDISSSIAGFLAGDAKKAKKEKDKLR